MRRSVEAMLKEFRTIQKNMHPAYSVKADEVLTIAHMAREETKNNPDALIFSAIMKSLELGFMYGAMYGRNEERKKAKAK